jgi:CBS domain
MDERQTAEQSLGGGCRLDPHLPSIGRVAASAHQAARGEPVDQANGAVMADTKTLGEELAGQKLVVGYDDELVGQVADRMVANEAGRVPILSRRDGTVVGLVARRDLLRVRANALRHEREREALMRIQNLLSRSTGGRPSGTAAT